MKKKSNLDILMIMFGFTFFSGSMLIGQKLSSGVEFSDYLYNNFIDFLSIMNYTLPPIGVVLIINYISKKDYSSKNINLINCIAVIIGGISAYFLKFGISSINAIIVTSLITIVGNYINNKIMINKGGSSYENK